MGQRSGVPQHSAAAYGRGRMVSPSVSPYPGLDVVSKRRVRSGRSFQLDAGWSDERCAWPADRAIEEAVAGRFPNSVMKTENKGRQNRRIALSLVEA